MGQNGGLAIIFCAFTRTSLIATATFDLNDALQMHLQLQRADDSMLSALQVTVH